MSTAKASAASKEVATAGNAKPGNEDPKNSTALATSKGNALSTEFAAEFDNQPSGMEQVKSKDLMIPRITILQKLSPQLEERKPEFIKDAKAGMICDTATSDVFQGSIDVLPCYFATVYLQWAPRSSGKGLQHNHGLDDSILTKCTKNDKGQFFLPNGDQIIETATWYLLNLTAGGRRSFLPLSSTQLKSSRRWMTRVQGERVVRPDGSEFQPPIFYRPWTASITHEANAQGDWFGWKFEPKGPNIIEYDPSKNLLNEAKQFLEQARSGLVQGDLSSYADDGIGSNGGDNARTIDQNGSTNM